MLRRNDWRHFLLLDRRDHLVRVVPFVPDEVRPLLGVLNELFGFGDIVNVAGGEMDVDWITESVDESVDFGSKASTRRSNTLMLGPPFPPAASWWAFA